MLIKELCSFIAERHLIYRKKAEGFRKPWTKDDILRTYKFCNVYRELDTVTLWIAKNWRNKHANDINLWFAMVVARLVNWPDTLQTIGYPVPWKSAKFVMDMHSRKNQGQKVFSGAYIVSTNGHTMDKAIYLVTHVLDPLWADRQHIASTISKAKTLAEVHALLSSYNGLGSFMAAQVIADLKYTMPMRKADDWMTWAASGPGSRRGLNRVCGKPVDSPWKEREWLEALVSLHKEVSKFIQKQGMPVLHAQDLQNCLCEFDKYMRVKLGEGRPRSLYPGSE